MRILGPLENKGDESGQPFYSFLTPCGIGDTFSSSEKCEQSPPNKSYSSETSLRKGFEEEMDEIFGIGASYSKKSSNAKDLVHADEILDLLGLGDTSINQSKSPVDPPLVDKESSFEREDGKEKQQEIKPQTTEKKGDQIMVGRREGDFILTQDAHHGTRRLDGDQENHQSKGNEEQKQKPPLEFNPREALQKSPDGDKQIQQANNVHLQLAFEQEKEKAQFRPNLENPMDQGSQDSWDKRSWQLEQRLMSLEQGMEEVVKAVKSLPRSRVEEVWSEEMTTKIVEQLNKNYSEQIKKIWEEVCILRAKDMQKTAEINRLKKMSHFCKKKMKKGYARIIAKSNGLDARHMG